MNTIRPNKKRKSRAQAMVEFALALPLLLLLLYGLLETGRLIFIYASTVTAARQAVRYGSAIGESPNGVPYFRDCDGIEAAAQNVGFINDFQNITINYDRGPGTPNLGQCPSYSDAANGDRIRVSVEAEWVPIVPIVPFDPFTIHSESARTILASVAIQVTAPAVGFQGSNTGILSIAKAPSSPTYSAVGEIITYTYTLSNTGGGDLLEPYIVTDDKLTGISCPGGTLSPGGSITCTGTYQITQNDIDTGSVTNLASATANGTPSTNSATATITAIQLPELTLTKEPSIPATSIIGTTITYTYTLTNSGNVTLKAPYSVSDNKIENVTCPGAANTIAPGDSVVCTANYQVTLADIDDGFIVNQATATAVSIFDDSTITSNTATATVITTRLYIVITASVGSVSAKDQLITYSYIIKNTGDTDALSVILTSSLTETIDCPTDFIAAGDTVICTGQYLTTQAIVDAGGMLVNTASATANSGTMTSNTASNSLLIAQTPSLSASVTGSPSQPIPPATTIPAGTTITYTYTLTNTGNVTLSSPFAVSDSITNINCGNQSSLAPLATKTCTGTYTVKATDVTAGSITNTGTASAKFNSQDVISEKASFTVTTFSDARFSLAISAAPPMITQSGTTVVFTYTITNTGGVPLTSPYSITHQITISGSSPVTDTFACNGTSPLAPGASTSCQNSYTTSNTITNTVTAATAKYGAATINSSNLPSITVESNICTTGTLTLSAPVYNSNAVIWTISNTVGSPLNINSITVEWNTTGNRYLGEVQLPGGTPIWSGSDKDGFAIFNGLWLIGEGDTQLVMLFTKTNITVTDMNLTFDELGCGPLNNP